MTPQGHPKAAAALISLAANQLFQPASVTSFLLRTPMNSSCAAALPPAGESIGVHPSTLPSAMYSAVMPIIERTRNVPWAPISRA